MWILLFLYSNYTLMEKRDLLFFCSPFKDKSDQEIEKIRCNISHIVKEYKKGEHIAFQGDKVQSLLMLIKGKVKTEMVSNSGLALAMDEISAPYPLAASFLFADDNRFPVDVIALQDCEVLFISKETIEKQIAKCPGFLRGFMSFNANRMQYISERLKLFAQKGIKAKLVYYILLHEESGKFDLERSVSSLAEYFGVERPSLSRAISEMVKDGIITYQNGKGEILNFSSLENLLV